MALINLNVGRATPAAGLDQTSNLHATHRPSGPIGPKDGLDVPPAALDEMLYVQRAAPSTTGVRRGAPEVQPLPIPTVRRGAPEVQPLPVPTVRRGAPEVQPLPVPTVRRGAPEVQPVPVPNVPIVRRGAPEVQPVPIPGVRRGGATVQ